MKRSPAEKKTAAQRRARLNRAEMPYWSECLYCRLQCDNILASTGNPANVINCPKGHKGEPFFPYKYDQMKRGIVEE